MSGGEAWQGNVRARLYERVRERGYNSLTSFAEAHPAVPLYVLADALGKDDVAAVQVLSGLLAEAEQRKQVTRFVRDVLVRELAEGLPDGWPVVMDDANRFEVAMALGRWSSYTPETHEERVRRAGDALLAHPPPPGWRPLGPDDELLRTLLPDEEA
ncbi:NUDIX hydrolase [Corallococcus sp. Z5C101001]|uniref:NUDIX hydrolase n=1 Tax=Corallococcus sp. Z5C101001 TaxID=2596829 RepID=UPI0011809B14|nr:NUDIX hydrolase [Corallococcus sp. Z5C101001]TSC27346.1 NUDIX hydrolase [Corallococcus sp. Z5C101001]